MTKIEIPMDDTFIKVANQQLQKYLLEEMSKDEAGIASLIVQASRRWPDLSFCLVKENEPYENLLSGKGMTTRWYVERRRPTTSNSPAK